MASGFGEVLSCEKQVVKIENGRYELEEETLKGILMKDDIQDVHVALISIAGAYRGGKSFLLDFFLRYLLAEPDDQQNGRWIYTANDVLDGFRWRGGSDRHTLGMLMWSDPVPLLLPTGQKVVVVLMDTQGTFDNYSTLKECSTIFALSTLLSSVQIFNLSKNIKEDDLQHLQLFMEYGRLLMSEDNVKPFQKLTFLVRDWSFPYEYPYGVEGGKQLLAKKLKIDVSQPESLQDLRSDIYSSFEHLDCFLLPFPGDIVDSDPNFKGRLSDISIKFKESLLELVPSICDPSKLIMKQIDSRLLTARDLFYYFKSYVEAFNSAEMPSPISIMQATAEANLLSTLANLRQEFQKNLDRQLGVTSRSMPEDTLKEVFKTIRDDTFKIIETKKLMRKKDVNENLYKLIEEFDRIFPQYEVINIAKTERVLEQSKSAYEKHICKGCLPENLCLNFRDLEKDHDTAVLLAMTIFDDNRFVLHGDDLERDGLIKSLTEKFKHLDSLNTANNKAAISKAKEDYTVFMEHQCGSQPCFRKTRLTEMHKKSSIRAFKSFISQRTRLSDNSEDFYRSILNKEIQEKFKKLLELNNGNNKRAVQYALTTYKTEMGVLVHPNLPCFHPRQFIIEHQQKKTMAFNNLKSTRNYDESEENDEFMDNLNEAIKKQYERFYEINEENNKTLVKRALEVYNGRMSVITREAAVQLYEDKFQKYHLRAYKASESYFKHHRNPQGPAGESDNKGDIYWEQLVQGLDEAFYRLQAINLQNPLPNNFYRKTMGVLSATATAIATGAIAGVVVFTGGLAIPAVLAGEGAVIAVYIAATSFGACTVLATWNNFKSMFEKHFTSSGDDDITEENDFEMVE